MSNSSESRKDGCNDAIDENVIQLGFNISVSGNSASDFEVFVNDKKQTCRPLASHNILEIKPSANLPESQMEFGSTGESSGEKFYFDKQLDVGVSHVKRPPTRRRLSVDRSPVTDGTGTTVKDTTMDKNEDSAIIQEIKNAMGNFEKFSEHVKEIPRFSTKKQIYTSTPYPDRSNSRSEDYISGAPRSFLPKHDFRDRKYFRKTKTSATNLFLKPLPGEGYFKSGFVRRMYETDCYRHYNSMESLPKFHEYGVDCRSLASNLFTKSEDDKLDVLSLTSDVCDQSTKTQGVLKKSDSEAVDKHSTSSESAKDIKIYQSGGIIIMQNFSDGTDVLEKKDLIDGAKLIENCSKLKDMAESGLQSSDESQKPLLNTSSDEVRTHSGKIVQFDLSSCENTKSRSIDSSSDVYRREPIMDSKPDASQVKTDFDLSKENIPAVSQNQDFLSLSTQENDSILSNLHGMSPTSSTSGKKLEWDSGADVGYLNMDMSNENISTIERIILRGLSEDGSSKKQISYKKIEEEDTSHSNRSPPAKTFSESRLKELKSKNGLKSKKENSSRSSKTNSNEASSQSDDITDGLKKRFDKSESRLVDLPENSRMHAVKHYSKSSKSSHSHHSNKNSKSDRELDLEKKPNESPEYHLRHSADTGMESKVSEPSQESIQTSDKSVYVNTLYEEPHFVLQLKGLSGSEESGRSETSDKQNTEMSPRVKKLKKKRSSSQTNLTARLKNKVDTIIDIIRTSSRSGEALPDALNKAYNEVFIKEQSAEASLPSRQVSSSTSKEMSGKNQSVSASVSSICLVDEIDESFEKHFADQVIQTDFQCKSKAIQAMESMRSSHSSGQGDKKSEIVTARNAIENNKLVYSCSKSIQAHGLNSSLPKHLAHPKEITFEQVNTKSTQNFGECVSSLPNYHSSLIAKESDPEKHKVLKNKLNSDTENNRIKSENRRNANAKHQNGKESVIQKNDNVKCGSDFKRMSKEGKKWRNDPENKENCSVDKEESTDNSKRTSGSCSKGSQGGSKRSAFGSCDVQISDDERGSVFLTSELLKEHAGSIDRQIIQEKYFESQLVELERKEMITRSTSVDGKEEIECNTQTGTSLQGGVSVYCQYSPQREVEVESDDYYANVGEDGVSQQNSDARQRHLKYTPGENTVKGDGLNTARSSVREKELVLGDSLSSSTQTAHSWVPGIHQESQQEGFAVGRAFSFEYLPGDIYENAEAYQGLSQREVVVSSSSTQSNGTNSIPKSESPLKESESAHTVVLENTARSPLESDRMKSLDENLTELENVVSKLHEKEAIFKKMTDTMLSNVTGNGSGDSSTTGAEDKVESSHADSVGTEELCCEVEIVEDSNKSNGSVPKENIHETGCQTENAMTQSSNYYEEKKELKKRMNNEKEQQIKWIENEINHLNMLRSLLEKPDESRITLQRRKRHHYLTEANSDDSMTASLKEEDLKKMLGSSLSQNDLRIAELELKSKDSSAMKFSNESAIDRVKELTGVPGPSSGCAQFGMALSLRKANTIQQVTMLPVGVQVTVQNMNPKKSSSESQPTSSERKDSTLSNSHRLGHSRQACSSTRASNHSEQVIQYPVHSSNGFSSTVTIGNLNETITRCKCVKCAEGKCGCLSGIEKRSKRKPSRSRSQSRKRNSETKQSSVQSSLPYDEIKRMPLPGTSRSEKSRSRESSKGLPSPFSSDLLNSLEKCQCICHCGPLPRCDSCNLLNTCKKCQCYKRIKCCLCKSSESGFSTNKKCIKMISTACSCDDSVCQTCRCSRLQNEKCGFCPCHVKPVICTRRTCKCKRMYEEKSSQTEGKDCKCCECVHEVEKDKELYRETKYMSEKKCSIESRLPSKVLQPAEKRYSQETKQPVDEKVPLQLKVPVENRTPSEMKNETIVKTGIVRKCMCFNRATDVKKPQCQCMQKSAKKSVPDDHPRQYFLQIEETTEESSSESNDNRNLEVITIRVPIRKMGKNSNNLPPKNSFTSAQTSPDEEECNCCQDCIGHSSNKYLLPDRPRTTDGDFTSKKDYGFVKRSSIPSVCNCCEDCLGRNPHKFSSLDCPGDRFEPRTLSNITETSYEDSNLENRDEYSCSKHQHRSSDYGYQPRNEENRIFVKCNCCSDCPGKINPLERGNINHYTDSRDVSCNTAESVQHFARKEKGRTGKCKKESGQKIPRKSSGMKSQNQNGARCRVSNGENIKSADYYNFNKKEYMTKSELEREEKNRPSSKMILQECLTVKRPDLYTRAECRRKIISEKARERIERRNKRMECLNKCLPQCDVPGNNADTKLFTTSQMRKQTNKYYRNLPEVTNKMAEEKRKVECRTNKLMAEIFAKKLQLQTLKGHLNLSNSFSVMSTK